jgi:hypothetical protein
MFSYTLRETLELQRDPVRLTLALLGSLILMFIIGYGINMDVEHLSYAVLDRDQTTLSQNYALNLAGSRYFVEHPPIADYAELDRRQRSGELSLAIEIPPGFARDVKRGTPVQIGAWIDGAMPQRAETVQGYVNGMHQGWLVDVAKHRLGLVTPCLQLGSPGRPSKAWIPEKLLASGGICEFAKLNHPVSRIDCTNAMSPRTPSMRPSSMNLCASAVMLSCSDGTFGGLPPVLFGD